MVDLRSGPSGPLRTAANVGWNVVRSAADLPAPVANVRSLDPGGWLIVGDVDLENDTVRCAGAGNYILASGGGILRQSGGAAADATLKADTTGPTGFQVWGLELFATSSQGAVICDLDSAVQALLFGINTGTSSGAQKVTLRGTNGGRLSVVDSVIQGASNAIRVDAGAQRLDVRGGFLSVGGSAGLISSRAVRTEIEGVHFLSGVSAISYNSQADSCIVTGCHFISMTGRLVDTDNSVESLVFSNNVANDCNDGIVFTIAPPTAGSQIIGNNFGTLSGAAFTGFTAAHALVFARGNFEGGAKMTDSPIV